MKYLIILFLLVSCNNKPITTKETPIKLENKQSNNRYFLVSFESNKIKGDFTFKSTGFFNRDDLVEAIGEGDIVILNIYEFKSREEYNKYLIKRKRKDLPKKQSFLC